MSAEEVFARSHGPALSIARSIYQTKNVPALGRTWLVEVHVIQVGKQSGQVQKWSDFSFKVQVTAELLIAARATIDHVTKRSLGNAWMVSEGPFILP